MDSEFGRDQMRVEDKTYKRSKQNPDPFDPPSSYVWDIISCDLIDCSQAQNWKTSWIFHWLLYDPGHGKHSASVSPS